MKHFFTNTKLCRRKPGTTFEMEEVECRVDITIDLDALFRELGRRALLNKSRSTIEIGGLIKATVKVLP